MTTHQNLYSAVTGTEGIQSVTVDADYSQPCKNAVVEANYTSLELGDPVTVELGYSDNHAQVFTGYLLEKDVSRSAEGIVHTLRCKDQLWRAIAMFIASDDPEDPLKYSSIPAETLVGNMCAISGITSYSGNSPGFTFATVEPVEIQLVSAWDVISKVCQLIAWHCYDDNGTVRFLDRKPYNTGDASVYNIITGNSGTIISIDPYSRSSDKIRNKVVVYGAGAIHATAQASSPFLPAGFYQAAVVAAPELIDTQSMAQEIADYNLNLLNRLEKTTTANIRGVPSLDARDTITITEGDTGISSDWLIYSCKHELRESYATQLTLVQRET